MRKAIVVSVVMLVSGCAPRYSIRQIRDYDMAISMAEKQGVDTTAMHRQLVEMLVSYAQQPGVDAQDQAMSGMAAASMMQAINSNPYLQPQYQAPPLSPMEYQHAVTGR